MSIFRDFFVKEKPVFTGITRGLGGFGFGGGGGGASTPSPGSASGGNIDAQPGGDGYNYHVFTTSGSLVVTGGDILDCELLCVGPGGGGSQGNGAAGGGGAGGVVHVTGHTLLSGTYTITIPAGGIGGNIPEGSPSPLPGVQGADLTMTSPAPFSITAKGGGGGQSWGSNNPNPQANANGGSGGGASGNPNNIYGVAQQPTTPYVVATGTVNRYGNPGGPTAGTTPGSFRGSGGGGAGAVGQNYLPSSPHYGGSGGGGQPFPSFIGPNPAFAPLPSAWKTAVGPTGHYAGGGAGGSENGGTATPAPGGQGGGGASGAGPNTVPAETMRGIPAVANTGGGGGAGWWDPGLAARGGNGANGIVLLRYQA